VVAIFRRLQLKVLVLLGLLLLLEIEMLEIFDLLRIAAILLLAAELLGLLPAQLLRVMMFLDRRVRGRRLMR